MAGHLILLRMVAVTASKSDAERFDGSSRDRDRSCRSSAPCCPAPGIPFSGERTLRAKTRTGSGCGWRRRAPAAARRKRIPSPGHGRFRAASSGTTPRPGRGTGRSRSRREGNRQLISRPGESVSGREIQAALADDDDCREGRAPLPRRGSARAGGTRRTLPTSSILPFLTTARCPSAAAGSFRASGRVPRWPPSRRQ